MVLPGFKYELRITYYSASYKDNYFEVFYGSS